MSVEILGRIHLGSIWNKNSWNNASKRLFGSYSHSGIPGFPFRLFCSQEQNGRNLFRNIFLFRNIPNERALNRLGVFCKPCRLAGSPRSISTQILLICSTESKLHILANMFHGSQRKRIDCKVVSNEELYSF